jgi:hypothetical protein
MYVSMRVWALKSGSVVYEVGIMFLPHIFLMDETKLSDSLVGVLITRSS